MQNATQPSLFGLMNSNRDFCNAETWGKNQFNSSFPASLACYLHSKGLKAVYLLADEKMNNHHSYIGIDTLFGVDPLLEDIYFSFETQFTPFQKYVKGTIPRNDLVLLKDGQCLSSLEIKLTALPDNTTCMLGDDQYGCEIVVRPDTIIYLACSIISGFNNDCNAVADAIGKECLKIEDWSDPAEVSVYLQDMYDGIANVVSCVADKQMPLIMQPVWKTEGKKAILSNDCLDVFIWSNLGMLNLFMPRCCNELNKISRHTRSMVWLYRMLLDYSVTGSFDGFSIIDEISLNTKNDKAFSSQGLRTQPLMACEELVKPRIQKNEIKNIILGGGQNLLSPERRFDAIIFNSPELFEE